MFKSIGALAIAISIAVVLASLFGQPGIVWGVALCALLVTIIVLPKLIGFTANHFGMTMFIWFAFGLVAAVLLALGGWITGGNSYISSQLINQKFMTITVASQQPQAFLLHEGGEFGIVNTEHRFVSQGTILGSKMNWDGEYTLLAVRFIHDMPIIGIGPAGIIMIEFSS